MKISAIPMEAIFILTPDYNEVLLLQKKPLSFLAGQRTGIGGKVDPGEKQDITQTVWRELAEESSITQNMLHSLTFRGTITGHAYSPDQKINYHMYAFTAICHDQNAIPLDSDDVVLKWIHKDELDSLQLTDFTEMIIKKIMSPHSPRFSGSYWKHKGERDCDMTFEE